MGGCTAEAVASGSELGDTFLFERGDDLIEGRTCLLASMLSEPCLEVKRRRLLVDTRSELGTQRRSVKTNAHGASGKTIPVEVVDRDDLRN